MIVLNELDYAEKCLADNLVDKKPFFTLNILAKYYYHHLGKDKKEIENLLRNFAKENCIEYFQKKDMWEYSIEKITGNCSKYPLYQIDGIWITLNELNAIDKLQSKLLRRLAFTLLCLAKFELSKNIKADGWINYDSKEIFQLARISAKSVEREIRLNDLYQLRLIGFSKKIDNLGIKIKFIDNDSDKKIFISDFRELGYEYLLYQGENFIRCGRCGILTPGNKTGTKKYCKSCVSYKPISIKKKVCCECGKEFRVSVKNTKSTRCPECQKNIVKARKREK